MRRKTPVKPLTPQDKRALKVIGLVLLDAFLGDEKRTLTRLGAPVILTPDENEKLNEALAKVDAGLCQACEKGNHHPDDQKLLCSCACSIRKDLK